MIEQQFIERQGEEGKPVVVGRAFSPVIPPQGSTVAIRDTVYFIEQVMIEYRNAWPQEYPVSTAMRIERVHLKVSLVP